MLCYTQTPLYNTLYRPSPQQIKPADLSNLIYHFAPGGVQSTVVSISVCFSVCLSVCPLALLENHMAETRLNFTKFLCMLALAMARSSSDGVAIRYELPVLWMTSCFHTIRPMDQNDVMFRKSSPGGGTSWTSDNYSVRSQRAVNLSECSTAGKVCHLWWTCYRLIVQRSFSKQIS